MPPLPAPGSPEAKRRQAWLGFWVLSGFALPFFAMGFVLGLEPRMVFERTGAHVFRVTASNHFAGVQIYSRTLEGVHGMSEVHDSSYRREDSMEERQRKTRHTYLSTRAADGGPLRWGLSWGRVEDLPEIENFMRSDAPTLALANPPPWWRVGLTCLSLGLGAFIFFRAVRGFFPKKPSPCD